MGNFNSYLTDNKEALSAANYNEIDALIFAALSYIKFENLMSETEMNNAVIGVRDFAGLILDNQNELKERGQRLSEDQIQMLEGLYTSERYANCNIRGFAAENAESQWGAITIDINDNSNTSVIAMRGTDGTTLGWTENFWLAYDMDGTNVQYLSRDYLEKSCAENIFLAGHSKGGNDVIAAYAMTSEEVRGKVLQIDNFDGPGVNNEFRQMYSEGYEELKGKLNNYYPKDSVIGLLLIDNPGNTCYIATDTKGHTEGRWIFNEHDPFSFQVADDDSTFIISEQSFISEVINDSLDKTLKTLTNDEKKNVIDVLEKLGIPSLIAGTQENPFSDNQEKANALVRLIDYHGFLPESVKEGLGKDLYVLASIIEGVEIWFGCSKEEREACEKALAGIAINAVDRVVEIAYDNILERIEQLKEKSRILINRAYGKAADFLYDIGKDIAEHISGFAENVNKRIREITDDITEYAGYFYDSAHDFIDRFFYRNGSNSGSRAIFCVNTDELGNVGMDMLRLASNIDILNEKISQIKSELNFMSVLYGIRRFWSIDSAMRKESKYCQRMGNLLIQVKDKYATAEHKISRLPYES